MTEKKQELVFEPDAMTFGNSVILQSLIIQLIKAKALTVEQAQGVFDAALKQTDAHIEQMPDATRYVQEVHDNFDWDALYRSAP